MSTVKDRLIDALDTGETVTFRGLQVYSVRENKVFVRPTGQTDMSRFDVQWGKAQLVTLNNGSIVLVER